MTRYNCQFANICQFIFLPSLTISNNQLTLTTTNWYQRVNGLNSSLHGFFDGNTWDDSRSFYSNTSTGRIVQGTLINGTTKY